MPEKGGLTWWDDICNSQYVKRVFGEITAYHYSRKNTKNHAWKWKQLNKALLKSILFIGQNYNTQISPYSVRSWRCFSLPAVKWEKTRPQNTKPNHTSRSKIWFVCLTFDRNSGHSAEESPMSHIRTQYIHNYQSCLISGSPEEGDRSLVKNSVCLSAPLSLCHGVCDSMGSSVTAWSKEKAHSVTDTHNQDYAVYDVPDVASQKCWVFLYALPKKIQFKCFVMSWPKVCCSNCWRYSCLLKYTDE